MKAKVLFYKQIEKTLQGYLQIVQKQLIFKYDREKDETHFPPGTIPGLG